MIGVALILAAMERKGKTLSEIVGEYPARIILKTQISAENFDIDRVKLDTLIAPEKINETDGLWLGFSDGFVHVRTSNTEPIIRIIAEAETKADAEDLIRKVESCLTLK